MHSQNENWRERALQFALEGFHYGEYLEALLHAVRSNWPDAATIFAEPERHQLLRFLEAETTGFEQLVQPTETYHADAKEDSRFRPFAAWYRVTWRGAVIELALAPNYGTGDVLCIGEDRELLREFVAAQDRFTSRPSDRCLRFGDGYWHSAPDLDREIGKVTWDDIVLPAETITRLRQAIDGWARNREAYRGLGFAWRRGILLVGPPGTGKTMVCKAAAAMLPDLPLLFVRNLREVRGRDSLQTIFQRARQLAPCLLAMEDMDGLISEENRTVFLNEMDGFANNEGILVIATSNNPHKIDEALLKRPSRFDRVFHIGLPEAAERAEFCRRVLRGSGPLAGKLSPELDVEALAQATAERTDGFTPAYLKEALVSAALTLVQDEGVLILDQRFHEAVLAQVEELRQHLRRMNDPVALSEMISGKVGIGFRR